MARRSSSNWAKVFSVVTAGLKPPEIQKHHAAFAREKLAEHMAGVKGTPPAVTKMVDGRRGASEDSVKPYGVIRYEFSYFREIAAVALDMARDMSPVDSGDYKEAWFCLADGERCEPDAIPETARRILITNDLPYHRKIHVGAMKNLSVPPLIVERLRAAMRRRYGNLVECQVQFILLEGGYILKGHRPVRKAAASRRSSAYRAGMTHLKPRKDTAKGQRLTYPALEMTLR